MRLRIHHGAVEVGGNCIELECRGRRILLDLGLPLDAAPRIPDVPGLLGDDAGLLGIVLSHPHLDHYGLLPVVRPDLPVWLGEGAIHLLLVAAPFMAAATMPQKMTGYHAKTPFTLGPFRITAYLMDHSAYDAHALLIEADGRRLFYSGDFRGHGRKAAVFERFLAYPPTNIDLLLMEGTTLGRNEPPYSESDVEAQAHAIMTGTTGLVLTCFSAQNMDRFVTFFRASLRAGRTFVMDAYLANLVSGLGLRSLPDPHSDEHVRVFLPSSQKRMIVDAGRFDLIEPFRRRRIYMGFPREHRAKLHSTNPIERLNGEIKRRTDVVGIFPNEAAITRLVGAILMEQSDEWAVQRARYMTLETMAPLSDNPIIMLSAVPGT